MCSTAASGVYVLSLFVRIINKLNRKLFACVFAASRIIIGYNTIHYAILFTVATFSPPSSVAHAHLAPCSHGVIHGGGRPVEQQRMKGAAVEGGEVAAPSQRIQLGLSQPLSLNRSCRQVPGRVTLRCQGPRLRQNLRLVRVFTSGIP